MDTTPLLHPQTETCGTSETCRNEWNVQVNDNEQQYWKNPSIYKIPAHITKLNDKAYQPQVVSFGPYHHDDHDLQPMEIHKDRARYHFFKGSGTTSLEVLESLRTVVRDLEESYELLDPKWKEDGGEGQDRFLKMMITDGCFMLEIMRNAARKKKNDYAPNDPNDYAPNDPIFSTHRLEYITPYIKRDMLMLENQLPMLVLECLVKFDRDREEHTPTTQEDDIKKCILSFFSLNDTNMGKCLHVLDVVRKGWLRPENGQTGPVAGANKTGPEAGADVIIRSATELHEAGIQFDKNHTRTLEDIFFGKGVLKLPHIKVDDAIESKFLNIMTFERLHIGAETKVTSYVIFMDNIINDERDVALLNEKGIIQNDLGSDKAVAELFNSLCKEVKFASNSSLAAVQKDISTHCEKDWNRWRAHYMGKYFRNPWTAVSLFAAILTFVLVIIQTLYAVLSYY